MIFLTVCPFLLCSKQSFTLLNMTDEQILPVCRSLLLFIYTSVSSSCCWTQTSPENHIPAHQSGLRLICQPLQQDNTLSLTMGSVMEEALHACMVERIKSAVSRVGPLVDQEGFRANGSWEHVFKTPGESGRDGRGGGGDEETHWMYNLQYQCILCPRLFTLKLSFRLKALSSLHTKYMQQIACTDS